jgi:hypothetical protein
VDTLVRLVNEDLERILRWSFVNTLVLDVMMCLRRRRCLSLGGTVVLL